MLTELSVQSWGSLATVYLACIQGNLQAWRYLLTDAKHPWCLVLVDSVMTQLWPYSKVWKGISNPRWQQWLSLLPESVIDLALRKEVGRPREGANSKQASFSETTCWIWPVHAELHLVRGTGRSSKLCILLALSPCTLKHIVTHVHVSCQHP